MVKIGLEIHKRIDTDKLFCDCPSSVGSGEPDNNIIRELHPVLSELGEIDEASRQEFLKNKWYEYQYFHSCDCLVDVDEEPPHSMNKNALLIALEISKHIKAKIIDEIHTMRKIVIDGSNTSGFQRTAAIAMDGEIQTSKGPIRIPFVSIEEESSGIVEKHGERTVFRLDRLGYPLLELNTAPDIQDADHLVEIAEKIGLILRATGKVARGIGTIRQDLNVSTPDVARVEIKGAQDLKILKDLVNNEIERQRKLLNIYSELEKRRFKANSHIIDFTSIFSNTKSKLLSSVLSNSSVIFALSLPGLKGIIGTEVQPGKRFGTELSEYAKAAGVKGIIHSDEDLSKYNFSETEIQELVKILGDSFVLVAASKKSAENALANVVKRLNLGPVPKETRRANPDGTTTYMRPLPGSARMYPETDIPPIVVDNNLLSQIQKGESLEEKREKLNNMLNNEMAEIMIKSRNLQLFEKLAKNFDPMLVATTLENTLVSLRREGVEFSDVDGTKNSIKRERSTGSLLENVLLDVFEGYKKGIFVKAAIPDILKYMSQGQTLEQALKKNNLGRITGAELKELIKGKSIGEIMREYRLRVDPAEVQKLLKK